MDILLLYMAGEGGWGGGGGGGEGGVQPDLKRENVHHVRNFISTTPLAQAHIIPWGNSTKLAQHSASSHCLCFIMSLRANIVRLSCY